VLPTQVIRALSTSSEKGRGRSIEKEHPREETFSPYSGHHFIFIALYLCERIFYT